MKNRLFTIVIIASLGLFLTGATFWILQQASPDASQKTLRKALMKEFKGVYSEKTPTGGEIKTVNITASTGEIQLFPDKPMQVWNYNGQVPGPQIRMKLGETLRINFQNNLPQETTIHFHGIRVPNAMDGVPGVTQDSIPSGEGFVYEFTPKDAGTYWYHPHVRTSEQLERGLYGVIVVEDEYVKKYSQDVVWVVDDWRLSEDYQINPHFVTQHDLAHDGRWGNVLTVNGKFGEELTVSPGERIRLRLVNTSNARVYELDFGGLNARGIAVDGLYAGASFDPQGFALAPGNRIDLDIAIPADADGSMYSILDTFPRNPLQLGQIIVKGESVVTSDFLPPSNPKMPDWSNATNLPIDKEYRLNARRKPGSMGMMGGIEWTINDQAYPNITPITLQHGTFNKLKFTNESHRLHPMHLHGQFFKVLTRNGQPAVDEPYFRDTVLLRAKETVEVGLVPLDKGEWANHCHIVEHADSGMMTLLRVE